MKVCLLPGTQLTSLSEGIAWLCMVWVKSSKIWVILDVLLSSKSLDQRETIPFQVNQIHSLTNAMCDVITKITYLQKSTPSPPKKNKIIAFLINYTGHLSNQGTGGGHEFLPFDIKLRSKAPELFTHDPRKLTASGNTWKWMVGSHVFPIEIVPFLGIFIDFRWGLWDCFLLGFGVKGLFSRAFVLLVLERVTVRPLKGLPSQKERIDLPTIHFRADKLWGGESEMRVGDLFNHHPIIFIWIYNP